MITVSKASPEDLIEFAHHVRVMDESEAFMTSGQPLFIMLLSIINEPWVKVIKSGDTILGIGGTIREPMSPPDTCRGWMLLTNQVEEHKLEFLKWSKKYVKELLKEYKYIYNDVYKFNKLHIDYLEWLGAEFKDHPFRKDFYTFSIRR